MLTNEFSDTFCNKILKNKWLIVAIIFVSVLCFGFTITNFSIGTDDPARNHYLYSTNEGSMIQQGRLLHVVLNMLTGAVAFIPFFNDFLGASLFALSALLFCALFQTIAKKDLPSGALISFATIYISYSIINEKFIYNLDVVAVMLSYCACAIALAYAFLYTKSKKRMYFLVSIAFLIVSISSYESFIFLYICGVFFIFLLRILINQEKISLKSLVLEGLKYALILILAVVTYYLAVVLVQILTHQYGNFVRTSEWRWFADLSPLEQLIAVTKVIIKPFLVSSYLPLREFTIVALVGIVFVLYLSVKRKDFILFICYLAFLTANFGIHYVVGFTMYRAAQTFCFFVAGTVLLLMYFVKPHRTENVILSSIVVLIVLIQSADMNRWFYNDHVRYQKEKFAVDSIATKLIGEFDVQKPVVFTCNGFLDYLYNFDADADAQVNGSSVINWGVRAFKDPTTPLLVELFHMHGYDFVKTSSKEQADLGQKLSEDMPSWPSPGSIKEYDDFIIVNIGASTEKA